MKGGDPSKCRCGRTEYFPPDCPCQKQEPSAASVSAALADDSTLLIVSTDEYEARKGPGIAAPFPGVDAVLLYPWGEDESVFYRAREDDEWVELGRLADGETFPLPVGSSVRLDAPAGVGLEMW